jgi:hypothetical protein
MVFFLLRKVGSSHRLKLKHPEGVMSRKGFARAVILAGFAVAVVVPAGAASISLPNYTLPDGSHGFALSTHGGPINPGVIVGFNPQPDPPAIPTALSLADPSHPVFVSPGPCTVDKCGYEIEMSFLGFGNAMLGLPPTPENGSTSFNFTFGDHIIVVDMSLAGPPGSSLVDWVAFNPQPDPPATWFASKFNFQGPGDPLMTFEMFVDGAPLRLTLGVPEPASWALMLIGFVGVAFTAFRRTGTGLRLQTN